MDNIDKPNTTEEKANIVIKDSNNNVHEEATALSSKGLYSTGSTKQDKCTIRKRARHFKLIDGVLHYHGKEDSTACCH